MPRVVVLGCGTGVGKTRVSVALLSELSRRGARCLGLKPIESGVSGRLSSGEPPRDSDAEALQRAGSLRAKALRHPLYGLPDPVSPHLAARSLGITISIERCATWVVEAEFGAMAPLVASDMVLWSVIETAGGVFSPLGPDATNFELGLALEPAIWIMVAADALGALHDVSATLQAMRARGRAPEHLVLCAAREPDASTGSNAAELAALGIAQPSAVLARDDDRGIGALVERLLDREP
jgi:dethiobiotin synthetase